MNPTIDFTYIEEVLDYANETIITNHNNEIVAVMHNNVENGLGKFIIQSPRNWGKARVIGSSGNYEATNQECILIFNSTATGSITLTNNRWNEWLIVNRTSQRKQLVGSIPSYKTPINKVKNYVSENSVLTIARGEDNIWYEIGQSLTASDDGNTFTATRPYPQFTVGAVGAPTLTNGNKTLTILDSEILNDMKYVEAHVQGLEVPQTFVEDFTEHFAYMPVYSTGKLELNFNESLANGTVVTGVKYPITYAFQCPTDEAVTYTAQTDGAETKPILDLQGNIFSIISGTQGGITIKLSAVNAADEAERMYGIWKYYASNIGGDVVLELSDANIWKQSFGEDLFSNVAVTADDGLGGVNINVTGLTDKIINWNAKITYDSSDL